MLETKIVKKNKKKKKKEIVYYGPVMPSRTLFYDFTKATPSQVQLHVKAKMEFLQRNKNLELDESDNSENHQSPNMQK